MAELDAYHTPHLTTALTGPLQLLEKKILSAQEDIEAWFQSEWKKTPAPIYGSVDLRNAGFKLAPVDMNLFPAGFNNLRLNPAFIKLSVEAAKHAISQINPNIQKILLVPENHTRNLFYWDNVDSLLQILREAGFTVRVGSLLEELTEAKEVDTQSGVKILLEPIKREANKIHVADFVPDVILLNNDLSAGIPEILQQLQQPLIPPAELGWSQRSKTDHFQFYAEVAEAFADLIKIDPWLISPLFKHCGEIDFMKREGESCLKREVGKLLKEIQKKYDEYDIPQAPYVVVKADAGTYGMAVMIVRNEEDIAALNRKQRTQMSKSKGGQPVRRVIIQEGVYTFETWQKTQAVAEPVVYMWGERVVGGFYRVHKDRGIDDNLNSPGMHFEPLAFVTGCQRPSLQHTPDECHNRFYAYGVIARLSMLASAREIQHQKNNA